MRYLSLLMIVVLFGCHQPEEKAVINKLALQMDSFNKEKERARAEHQKQYLIDSLKQDTALAKILAYAYQHIDSSYFKKDLNVWDDSTLASTVSFGNIFSKDRRHLIIQNRINLYDFNENVYLLENSKFINVVKETTSNLAFVTDSITDANGDHYKDFLFNWYPESGCCARNVFNVYLYLPGNGKFSKKYEFINPDFSPKEKIIRGVNYGHPGEVPLYKYKWNGLKVDTIEYIYPTDTSRKKFYLVHRYGDKDNPKKRKVISAVPKEYRKTGGYQWFMLE